MVSSNEFWGWRCYIRLGRVCGERVLRSLCRWLLCLAFLTHLLSPTLILSRDAVPQRIGGRLAIKPLLTSTCYLRSGHGCPEHSGLGMPDRTDRSAVCSRCEVNELLEVLPAGRGGAPFVNLNRRSKTWPIFLVKSEMYLSNEPSYTVKNPTWLSSSERIARNGECQLCPGLWLFRASRSQNQFYFRKGKT